MDGVSCKFSRYRVERSIVSCRGRDLPNAVSGHEKANNAVRFGCLWTVIAKQNLNVSNT